MYNIRFAKKEDLSLILEFLDTHWKKNHSLVVSKELIDFQHLNPISGDYNFIIAENKLTKKLDALKGFIPTYQYDKNLNTDTDLWAAIWKVRKDIKEQDTSNLAVYLWEMYFSIPDSKSYASIGISNDAIRVHKATRNFVSVINQYYILNEKCNNFKIAKIEDIKKVFPDSSTNEKVTIEDNFSIENLTEKDIQAGNYRPKKSLEYLKNRYLYHPIYKYILWGIFANHQLKSIWVLRALEVEGIKVLRIVDMYGADTEELPFLYEEIQRLLSKYNAEYIDCLNYGFDEETFAKMGFSKLNLNATEIIIPNYFEPFEQNNISLYFTYKLKDKKDRYIIFKGDSDQDRPNIIK